jgi:hypothetical protein
VGNVGQLACDLLIATTPGMRKAAYLDCDLVVPVVGGSAYGAGAGADDCISLPLEGML